MTEPIFKNVIRYSAPIHWFWVVAISCIAIFFLLRIYLAERGQSSKFLRSFLFLLRSLIVLLVLLSSLNWNLETKKFRKPTIVFLFDNSASLQHLDEVDDPESILARLEELKADLPSRLNLLRLSVSEQATRMNSILDQFEIVSYSFGKDLIPIGSSSNLSADGSISGWVSNLNAQETVSNLNAAIKRVIAAGGGQPPAAIVAFTDGIASDGRELNLSKKYATAESVPVFFVGLGDQNPASDIFIERVGVNKNVFVNDLVEFEIMLSANGLQGQKTVVSLFDAEMRKTVAEKEVLIRSDRFRSPIRFRTRMNQSGRFEYLIAAKSVEQEFDKSNNEKTVSINVNDDQIRVLLVYDYPSREFNYLKQFLGRPSKGENDPDAEFSMNRIQLDTFLQQADIEYAATDRHAIKLFPVNKEQLFQYDVIIFGDVKPNWAGKVAGGIGQSELDHLKEFVEERGGGVVFIAGPKFTPSAYSNSSIADLFPIDMKSVITPISDGQSIETADLTTEFQLRQTPAGRRFLPMDISDGLGQPKSYLDFRGAYWFATSRNKKIAAQTFAEFESEGRQLPAILFHTVGSGSVLYHAFPETHRWRFRQDETYFGRYWSQMIQYLASSKLAINEAGIELETDRSQYYRGEAVTLIATLFDRTKVPDLNRIRLGLLSASGRETPIEVLRRSFQSNVYNGTIDGLSPGSYRVKLIDYPNIKTNFEIVDGSRENIRQPINEEHMRKLAEESGGKFLKVDELGELPRALPATDLIEMGSDPPWFFWHQWQFILFFGAVVVVLLTTEWILRKMAGMI